MSKFLQRIFVCAALMAMPLAVLADDYQLPDPGFEDWSGAAFDGKIQPKYWHASNVEQSALGMTFRFNFANRETGRSGYCIMAQDQVVGAAGITETSPSYYSLGYGWQHLEGLNTGSATAGTKGGYAFTHRPDSISVWIKRTGNNVDKEDFHVLFYTWAGTAVGTSYKNKNGGCTSVTIEDEESDIRVLMNGNECITKTPGGQVAEGWWFEKKAYGQWTNLRIPIYYLNDNAPKKCNLILSASNYPNFRANDGLYDGNALYVDDVELIYSSKIQTLNIGGKEWKGFDPNSSEVQIYSVPEGTTVIPSIEAFRGAGSLTNPRGTPHDFPGRKLSGSEITIVNGTVGGTPTTITVKAEDGSSTTTYKILFQAAKSSNAKLANIFYTYTNINDEQVRAAVTGFNPSTYNYKVVLPYGAEDVPTVEGEKQEDEQTLSYSQASSLQDKATITVTAANGTSKQSYNLTFEIGKLADNTLKDIQVNGKSVPGFTPSQAVYKVSLPTSTTSMPTVKAISAYPDGEQTIVHKAPATIDGGTYTLSVTTPGNIVAKVYKLNFKLEASSYSYLKDLKVGDYIKNFDPQNTTYYVGLPKGTTKLPEITWTPGDEYQKVTKTDLGEGVVDGTVRVTVTAGNGDQTVYKIIFSTEKSDADTLSGILIGGVALPNFSANTTNYTYLLPVGTEELPEIKPIPGDEYQTISVTTAGLNGKTRITVTAGNGSIKIYIIAFSLDVFTDNTLASLSVAGYDIDFDPEKTEYWVNMPQGTTVRPTITYQLVNENLQTASARDFSGLNGDYKITVRPQNGASRTYIIHFSVATSSNTALKNLAVAGYELTPAFDPEILEYEVTLAEGISKIPAVTFEKAETSQRVLSVLNDTVQTVTVTAQSGAKRDYTIIFHVQLSQNAFLDMIYLDGEKLKNFAKDIMSYTDTLKSEKCPAITVDKAPGQQVTITAPYAAGTATIKVQPEVGAANYYYINFEKASAESALLGGILINSKGLVGFNRTTLNYTREYVGTLPTVAAIKAYESQEVQVLWKDSVASLHVKDTLGNKVVYTVTFTRQAQSNKALKAILINGNELDKFKPEVLHYDSALAPGSSYPEVRYIAEDNAQVVFFGQMAEGQWGITVAAENGDTATYTMTFTILPYTDVTLENLVVEGYPFAFDPENEKYDDPAIFTIDQGKPLPKVTPTAKPGQTVVVFNVNDHEQQVLVRAQNGDEKKYIIRYTRAVSSYALLKAIYIDGKELLEFRPEIKDYTITLPRGRKVVPNVFPVGQLDNQTITTTFSAPNGVTTIHVEAQDGTTTADYSIAFPVAKSDTTLLKSLIINEEVKDVNETEYTFNVPYGTVEPYAVKYEQREGQLVHLVEAPLTGTTKIFVTNEKGDNTRTYTINYVVAQPQGDNKVKNVKYSYVNAASDTIYGNREPVPGNNTINLPFGAKNFTVTEVEKNYDEQTIQLYNGGIRRGATIIAVANRAGEDDVTYTLTPIMPAFDKAGKLQDLKFNGTTVPNFRPDVYNYIINVTNQPTAEDFTGTTYEAGKGITKSGIDATKKQITIKVDEGETYSICWFYDGDEWPFTYERVATEKAYWYEVGTFSGIFGLQAKKRDLVEPTGYKPQGWHVPADLLAYILYDATVSTFTYYTGHEVTVNSEKVLTLSTLRGGALNSSMPGTMTLGGLSLPSGVALNGNTKVSYEKTLTNAVQYRNTPEQFAFDYQPIMTTRINAWSAWVSLGNASGTELVSKDISGTYANLGQWQTKTTDLSYNGTVGKLNIMLCASEVSGGSYNIYGGKNSYAADLQIRNMRMVYNSALTGVNVNGKAATLSGNTFTITVADDYIGVPALKFTGAVQDQTQTIEWLNNGEWIDGKLTAKVVNYGENALVEGRDSTIYQVILQRTPVTSTNHTADFGTFAADTINDSIFVKLPYGTKVLPDLKITPASIHQLIAMTKKGNAVTVNVKAENGDEKTTVYVFREVKSDDVEFEMPMEVKDEAGHDLTLNIVDPTTFTYSVEAEDIAKIDYVKKDGQLVDINYTKDQVVLSVTAQDGVTKRTYTINRLDPVVSTKGQIESFDGDIKDLDGKPVPFGGEEYEATAKRPATPVLFTRKDSTDAVVFIQTPLKMEWQVTGTESHNYILTYPTEPSKTDTLKMIQINGVDLQEFVSYELSYDVTSDTTWLVSAISGEMVQTVAITPTAIENGVEYAIEVTAENDTIK